VPAHSSVLFVSAPTVRPPSPEPFAGALFFSVLSPPPSPLPLLTSKSDRSPPWSPWPGLLPPILSKGVFFFLPARLGLFVSPSEKGGRCLTYLFIFFSFPPRAFCFFFSPPTLVHAGNSLCGARSYFLSRGPPSASTRSSLLLLLITSFFFFAGPLNRLTVSAPVLPVLLSGCCFSHRPPSFFQLFYRWLSTNLVTCSPFPPGHRLGGASHPRRGGPPRYIGALLFLLPLGKRDLCFFTPLIAESIPKLLLLFYFFGQSSVFFGRSSRRHALFCYALSLARPVV